MDNKKITVVRVSNWPGVSIFLGIFLLIFSATAAHSQSISATAKDSTVISDPLRVGIAGTAPFVFSDTENPRGIAIDIWEDLADEKGWSYAYQSFGTVESALHALQSNELDIVVGPISITSSRVGEMSFSQPYYQSSLSMVSRADGVGIWARLEPFFSLNLLIAVAFLLLILAIVGTLFWMAEHKSSSDHFPQDPVKGIGNGMWLAIVTMSTTGYGDIAPITVKGRILAGIWMVVTIIFATSMVAGIASTLTLSGLDTSTVKNAGELNRKKAATISGSPALEFLQEYRAIVVQTDSLAQAIARLESNDVDVVVYDRPQLLYFLKETNDETLYLAKAEYYKQGYGFAFPLGSPLVYHVNRVLLKLAEDHEVQRIIEDYLGDENLK